MKNIEDPTLRYEELAGAFRIADARYEGGRVILIDDLFRSGETLSAIAAALKEQGKVARVVVLTMTKTRSRR